jgi:RNA polymerase sigma-70 factor (ECF subfamily)
LPADDAIRPWLFGVARNQLRSGWRRRKRSAALTERISRELLASPQPTAAVDEVDPIETKRLLEAMGALREADREIIRLVAWEELSHREIATVLGCTENAVAIRLHRARSRLSKALDRSHVPAVRSEAGGE